LALVIDFKIPGWKAYRTLFLIPLVLMQVAISFMWLQVLAPNGALNSVLGLLGLESLQHAWLGEPGTALGTIIAVTIWQFAAFPMIFILAGLNNINEDIYEAARIDGASTFRRIISITIPLIKNVLIVVGMLQAIQLKYWLRNYIKMPLLINSTVIARS